MSLRRTRKTLLEDADLFDGQAAILEERARGYRDLAKQWRELANADAPKSANT